MRKVDRDACPPSLAEEDSAGARELVKARQHFTAKPAKTETFSFAAYKKDDVRHALEKLFHGKCAYCETRYGLAGPVDIEHFRPKNAVEGETSGYWWLAATWTNLLPSCIDCNRRRYQDTPVALASLSAVLDSSRRSGFDRIKTGKETCFPIFGTRLTQEPPKGAGPQALRNEDPMLLNPCDDRPADHIGFYIDRDEPLGVVFAAAEGDPETGALPVLSPRVKQIEEHARAAGISVRGAVSIQVYGLNRLALVQERTRILRHLEFMADTIVNLFSMASELDDLRGASPAEKTKLSETAKRLRAQAHRTMAEIRSMAEPDAPYSVMVGTWLKSFRADLSAPQRAELE